jgi:hypothetical protein
MKLIGLALKSAYLAANRQPDTGNIYHSQIHECGNWETEHYNSVLEVMRPAVSFLGIHQSEPDIYIVFSPALHLQCKTAHILIMSKKEDYSLL